LPELPSCGQNIARELGASGLDDEKVELGSGDVFRFWFPTSGSASIESKANDPDCSID